MHISERTSQDVCVIDLDGRLLSDDGSADLLRDKVISALFRGHTRLVLNLARVPHIDSGALGTLAACYVTAKKANASLKLGGVTGRVVNLLTITKLITVFESFDTEQEAVDSFLVTA